MMRFFISGFRGRPCEKSDRIVVLEFDIIVLPVDRSAVKFVLLHMPRSRALCL